MPDLTTEETLFRAGGYSFTGYVASIPYTVVLAGTVTATPTFPALTVSYTLDSGSETDVLPDMLVVFFDSSGRRIGQTRVAEASVSSTVLPIGETSAGAINIVSGDFFRVYDAVLLFDRLVAAQATLDKDSRIPISDNGTNPPPVANAGGLWFGDVDPGQTYATVTLSAANSFTVDPDSAGTMTYLWAVGDGTITTGTTTTEDITAQFPQGFRHVRLTVTDSGNGKSETKLIPVRVFDADNRPVPVIMQSLSGDVQNGWQAEFETPAALGASINDIPDGALIVYWENEQYGSTSGSYGSNNTGRSHIKFAGYLVRDNIAIDPEDDVLTFGAESPLMILDDTPALPQYIANKTAPNKWRFVKSLTVNRIMWYLIYWHSSYLTYFDWLWFDGTDLSYREIAVKDSSSVGAQIRSVAQSINCFVTCDRLGVMRIIRNPQQLTIAERTARTTTYNFTTADALRVEFEREHRGAVKQVTAGGITGSLTKAGTQAVFSKAPGTAPSHAGTGSIDKSDYIVTNQAAINRIAGLLYAEENSLYYGQKVPQGLTLTVPDGYDVFDPAYCEFLTFDLPAGTNKRGVSFADTERWVLKRVSIGYDPIEGAKDITLTLDHETFGVDGVTYVPPQPAQNKLPSFQPLDLQFPSFPAITYPSPIPEPGAGTLALVDNAIGRFVRTDDFNTPSWAGGPTWAAIPLTGSVSGTWLDWVGDAFSPRYLGTGTQVNGWLATTTGIYRISDLFGTATATLQHTFAAVSNRRKMQATRTRQNFVSCVSYRGSTGGITATTTTDGTTWTEVTVSAHYNTAEPITVEPTIYVSEHQANTIYVPAFTATGSGVSATSALYKSIDDGATWAVDTGRMTNAVLLGSPIYFPYQGNAGDNLFYWTNGITGSTASGELYRTTGTTQVSVNPNPLAATSGANVSASDDNRLRMIACYSRFVSGIGRWGMAVTTDGGNTWINRIPETTSNRWFLPFMVNDNAAYLLGEGTNRVGYTSDFGATIDNRLGNLTTGGFIKVIGA